jgi:hypothetical protein
MVYKVIEAVLTKIQRSIDEAWNRRNPIYLEMASNERAFLTKSLNFSTCDERPDILKAKAASFDNFF